jgi:hypothetical protein
MKEFKFIIYIQNEKKIMETNIFFYFKSKAKLHSNKPNQRNLLTSSNFLGGNSGTLAHHGIRLGTAETTTPLASVFLEFVVVVGLDSGDNGRELRFVSILDLSEGNSSRSLLVDESTKTSLTLNNAVRDIHLAAESRQVQDKFDGVNIISNDDELSLLGLDQSNNVVQTILDDNGLFRFNLLALSLGSSSTTKTLLLLSSGFGSVLGSELEELGSSVLVQNLGELVDGWWNLEALVQDLLLTLKTNILGPLDKTREITLGLDILTDAKVAATLLNKRVGGCLGGGLALDGVWGGSNLLASRLLCRGLVIEEKKPILVTRKQLTWIILSSKSKICTFYQDTRSS